MQLLFIVQLVVSVIGAVLGRTQRVRVAVKAAEERRPREEAQAFKALARGRGQQGSFRQPTRACVIQDGKVTRGHRILGGEEEVEHWAKFNEYQLARSANATSARRSLQLTARRATARTTVRLSALVAPGSPSTQTTAWARIPVRTSSSRPRGHLARRQAHRRSRSRACASTRRPLWVA